MANTLAQALPPENHGIWLRRQQYLPLIWERANPEPRPIIAPAVDFPTW
jgi:hypothetical protein